MKDTKFFLFFLSLIALALIALVTFELGSVQAKNQETSRLLSLAEQIEDEQVLIQSVRVLRNNASEEIEAFEAQVLTDDRLVPAIELIERAGRAIGLEVEIVSVEKPKVKKDEPSTIQLDINASGSWSDNLTFLQALESLPYRLMFEGVSLNKEATLWRSHITIVLYSLN